MRTSKLLYTCAAACLLAAGAASGQMIKPGLVAPGQGAGGENYTISDVYTVRYIFDQTEMYRALNDEAVPFENLMMSWTQGRCAEVIMAIRTKDTADPDGFYDLVPASAADRATMLDLVGTFIGTYGDYFSHVQAGNEIFSGSGRYRVKLPTGEWVAWGELQTPSEYQYWLNTVFDWQQQIVDVVEEAAALNGYQITIISPSVTDGFVQDAADNLSGPEYAGLERTIAFGNRFDYLTAIHLHTDSLLELTDTINNFRTLSSIPDRPTCLEWTPAGAARFWRGQPGSDNWNELVSMYDGVSQGTWNQFTADWLAEVQTAGLMHESLDDFMVGALAAMDANGFEHGLYGQAVQSGNPNDPKYFDMTATLAQNTIAKQASPSQLSTHFVNAYEAAAAAYHRQTLCDIGSQ